MPGSHNDISVLRHSAFLDSYQSNPALSQHQFTVEGKRFTGAYLLADGCKVLISRIYPEWTFLVKTIAAPGDEAGLAYKNTQEAVRKDVERAIGTLKPEYWVC